MKDNTVCPKCHKPLKKGCVRGGVVVVDQRLQVTESMVFVKYCSQCESKMEPMLADFISLTEDLTKYGYEAPVQLESGRFHNVMNGVLIVLSCVLIIGGLAGCIAVKVLLGH